MIGWLRIFGGIFAGLTVALGNPYEVNLTDLSTFRAGNDAVAQFRMYLPNSETPVRHVLLLTPGYNSDGRAMATDPAWQEFAQTQGCALVATYFRGDNPRYQIARIWSGKATEAALKQLAELSGHPEIAQVPWLLWGHSAGGQFNYNLTCWKPERVTAFVLNKSGIYSDPPSPGSLRVPGLFFAGETDTDERLDGIATTFARGRRMGAPWCFLMELGTGHESGRTAKMARTFFNAVLARKENPEAVTWEGSLSDHSIRPSEPGEPTKPLSAWLPDEATARLWEKMATGEK